MDLSNTPEVWLRGPVPGIPFLLQPVAHALLQAREEVREIMEDFPDSKLWHKPAEAASAGFHLQHLTGVVDRLFTYARGESLTPAQLKALSVEGTCPEQRCYASELTVAFNRQVDKALEQLRNTDEKNILDPREVGRAKLPSTVLSLLVHAAEHTMRHLGQLIVTVKVVRSGDHDHLK